MTDSAATQGSAGASGSAANGANRMRAITIARLYGSGGGEVARRIAERLGWRLVDHEVIVELAHQLGITEEEAEDLDEHTEGFILRALNSMSLMYPSVVENVQPLPSPATRERTYQNALRRIIELSVEEGNAVIVGRGAGSLLMNRRDVLRVYMVAPLEQRIAYVARREGLDEQAARKRIQTKDNDRRRYAQAQYHLQPDDPTLYDVTLNTAILSLDAVAELVCEALTQKAKRLQASESELGPASGMGLYPSQPEDVPAPEPPPESESHAQGQADM
ncbi:MAG TPA: cytidylate kinase-like family protein [Ktedonobacterales bacterium]|nr:cytidylate kinase-like family protein [Ktedonobacterales bacterium]